MNLSNKSIEKSLPYLFGLVSGFCVFYFLYVFRAYGIEEGYSYSGHSLIFRSSSFGLLTFSYITILERWLKPRWQINSLSRKIIWFAFLILLGCQLIFILFNYFWNWQEWNFEAYGLILREFPLMMALSLILYSALASLLRKNISKDNLMVFSSENGKDILKIRSANFLYAEAMENYIAIFYDAKGKTERHLIRKPLKLLAKELSQEANIVRFHRSFLANTNRITSIKQKKGKVLISITNREFSVSKTYQKNFLKEEIIRP